MTTDLTELIRNPDLAPLWSAIHDRLSAGSDPASITRVRVPGMSLTGIATLRSWLDTTARRRRGPSAVAAGPGGTSVPVRQLLTVLDIKASQLGYLAEAATGRPVVSRRAARKDAAQLRQDLWDYAAEMLPELPCTVAKLRIAGIADTDRPTRHFIGSLATALQHIPADPPVCLAKLSHDCAGDPHFFDLHTAVGARLVSAIAEIKGQTEPTRPDLIRAFLAEAGVIADRLTATVMLYRVAAVGQGPIDRRLRDSEYPVALTLLDLTVSPPTLADQVLTVVENPSVIEAALVSGNQMPMACTSGHLGSVDHALLQLAADQGLRLRYASDLDAPGYWIAEYVRKTYGAEIIAMDATTVTMAGPTPSTVPLDPIPEVPETSLAEALRTIGKVIFQEHDAVLDQLLGGEGGLTRQPSPHSRAGVILPGSARHGAETGQPATASR